METVAGARVAKQEFRGEGRSKKAAEHAAAKEALNFFRERGLLPAEPAPCGNAPQQHVPQYQVMPLNQVPVHQNYGAMGVELHQAPPGHAMMNFAGQQNIAYGPLGLMAEPMAETVEIPIREWGQGERRREKVESVQFLFCSCFPRLL